VESNELSLNTMDTTSHDFNWQVFEFGEHGHSRLNDVAIINENNIIAVGEIYMNDSLGNPDFNAYNAVHWDGTDWKLHKIIFYTFCPQGTGSGSYPARAVFALDNENIVISSGSQVAYLNNGIQISRECIPTSVNKIWGSSSNDIYVVGNNGNIARYLNGTWRKIESGTDVDLYDVWGSSDGKTVWACGYTNNYATSTLLRYNGTQIEIVYEGNSANQNNGYYIGPISGVWGTGSIRIYMMNWGGIYVQSNSSTLFLEKEIARFSDVGFGIDGTDHNNIFACGEGFVGHWNGISYTEYPELYKDLRTFYSISTKGNSVCAVGSDYEGFIYSRAVIALAK
jgi:hypothetical protein